MNAFLIVILIQVLSLYVTFLSWILYVFFSCNLFQNNNRNLIYIHIWEEMHTILIISKYANLHFSYWGLELQVCVPINRFPFGNRDLIQGVTIFYFVFFCLTKKVLKEMIGYCVSKLIGVVWKYIYYCLASCEWFRTIMGRK